MTKTYIQIASLLRHGIENAENCEQIRWPTLTFEDFLQSSFANDNKKFLQLRRLEWKIH